MTVKKHTKAHEFWRRRVEGQIRDCMKAHPEWFTPQAIKHGMVRSMAKRIIGEIVVVAQLCDNDAERMVPGCAFRGDGAVDGKVDASPAGSVFFLVEPAGTPK